MWVLITEDRNGHKIYLSKDRWRHIHDHEQIPDIQEIVDTLSCPTAITQPLEQDRTFYHRYDKGRKEYVLVVVKFINDQGYILTSHYTNKIK